MFKNVETHFCCPFCFYGKKKTISPVLIFRTPKFIESSFIHEFVLKPVQIPHINPKPETHRTLCVLWTDRVVSSFSANGTGPDAPLDLGPRLPGCTTCSYMSNRCDLTTPQNAMLNYSRTPKHVFIQMAVCSSPSCV